MPPRSAQGRGWAKSPSLSPGDLGSAGFCHFSWWLGSPWFLVVCRCFPMTGLLLVLLTSTVGRRPRHLFSARAEGSVSDRVWLSLLHGVGVPTGMLEVPVPMGDRKEVPAPTCSSLSPGVCPLSHGSPAIFPWPPTQQLCHCAEGCGVSPWAISSWSPGPPIVSPRAN